MPGVSRICARATRVNSPTPRDWPPSTTAPGSWRSNGTGRAAPRPPSSARTPSGGTGSRDGPGSTTRPDAASPHWRDGTPRRPPGSGRTSTGPTRACPKAPAAPPSSRPSVSPRPLGTLDPARRLARHARPLRRVPGQALARGGRTPSRPGRGRPLRHRRARHLRQQRPARHRRAHRHRRAGRRGRPPPPYRGPRRLPADPPVLPGVRRHRPRGPAARYVRDVARRENSLWVVPFGASGVPDSRHHRDQLPLWVRGDLAPVVTDWTKLMEDSTWRTER